MIKYEESISLDEQAKIESHYGNIIFDKLFKSVFITRKDEGICIRGEYFAHGMYGFKVSYLPLPFSFKNSARKTPSKVFEFREFKPRNTKSLEIAKERNRNESSTRKTNQ